MKGNRLWLLGTIAVIAVVVVLGWFLGISPKLAEGDAAASEQADVDALNATQEAALIQLREQFANLDELKADLDELRLHIPATPDVDTFVYTIQAAAVSAGVTVKSVTISEPSPYGTVVITDGSPPPPPPAEGEATPPSGAPENVYTIGLVIEVTGSADSAIRFSKLMQLGQRLYVVPNFTFVYKEGVATLGGFLYVIDDPNAPVVNADGTTTDAPISESTPTPDPTESPAPTETPAP